MTDLLEYGFWFWTNKLDGLLLLLAALAQYELSDEEIEIIRSNLPGTNDEENTWTQFSFEGQKHEMNIQLAHDAEEGSDMVHIRIQTTTALKVKLETLDFFQSMLKNLEIHPSKPG